jgi:hypothetical protein
VAVTPLGLAQWLTGPSAQPVIEEAQALRSLATGASATLAATAALRRAYPELAPEQCSAALTQASLRGLASERYGIEGMPFLTRDGLEQATRPVIARRRAAILAAGGCARVVDLTAGLGFDASAFVSAGLDVTVVERSPETSALLAANVPAARLVLGDATDAGILAEATASLGTGDVVFIDPARRDPSGRRTSDGSRAQSERDPQRWSPPWSFVASLARHHRVCVKTTPGFPPERLPAGWHGEWTSVAGTATEACLWSWPAFEAPRRSVRFGKPSQSHDTEVAEFEGTGMAAVADVAGVGGWLHEPDTSIIKAGLVDDLAATFGLKRLDAGSSWLTGHAPVSSPFIRDYEVAEILPSEPKALRSALRERGIGALTIVGRSTGIEPEALRKRLGLDGPNPATIVLAVSQGRRVTLLVAPR